MKKAYWFILAAQTIGILLLFVYAAIQQGIAEQARVEAVRNMEMAKVMELKCKEAEQKCIEQLRANK